MPFLKDAIQSVQNQTYKNWELIFWDNCSSDGSYQFVKNITDSRIRPYQSDQHKTLYVARNDAFRKVRGEFLCILDCDDYWQPKKLQKQLEVFDDSSIQMCCTNFKIVSNKIKILIKEPIFKRQLGISDVLRGDMIAVSSCMYKTNLLKGFSGPFSETEIIGDMQLHVKILEVAKGMILPQKMTCIRLHENNQSLLQAKLGSQEKRKFLKSKQHEYSKKSKNALLFKNARFYDVINKRPKNKTIKKIKLSLGMRPSLLQIKALLGVFIKRN